MAVPTLSVIDHTVAASSGGLSVQTSYEQTVSLAEGVDGGSFKLSVANPSGTTLTTQAIAYDASSTDVLQALLSAGLSANDVIVTGGTGSWQIQMVGAYAGAGTAPVV
jgi:hypothetical protein